MTVRLPLVGVTIHRPPAPTASGDGGGLSRRPVQRVVFYASAAALGALGVVEWPAVLLIAGGSYLAGRGRSSSPVELARQRAAIATDGS